MCFAVHIIAYQNFFVKGNFNSLFLICFKEYLLKSLKFADGTYNARLIVTYI